MLNRSAMPNQSALFRATNSNQPALFRATNHQPGTWYQKTPNNDYPLSETKIKAKKHQKVVDRDTAKEIQQSLFHYSVKCPCKLCCDYENVKRQYYNEQSKQAQKPVELPSTGAPKNPPNISDHKPKPNVKAPVEKSGKSNGGKLGISRFESFNKFGILSDEDPGNKTRVSQHSTTRKRRCKSKNLKGGANSAEKSNIFKDTIKVAKTHGIQLAADTPNAAQGNCLFDSVVDNINHRPDCFPEKLKDGVDCYRELWVTELEENYKTTPHYPGYGGNPISDEVKGEWTAAWTQQMNPGEYNVDHFNVSDLTPAGLGHCINKNILVFSTDPNEPVKVFSANYFDENILPETDIPVIIAYDSQNLHYESLLPKGESNVQKCIALVKAVKSNTYNKEAPQDFRKIAQKAQHAEAMRK